jgi:hypothetical protein
MIVVLLATTVCCDLTIQLSATGGQVPLIVWLG